MLACRCYLSLYYFVYLYSSLHYSFSGFKLVLYLACLFLNLILTSPLSSRPSLCLCWLRIELALDQIITIFVYQSNLRLLSGRIPKSGGTVVRVLYGRWNVRTKDVEPHQWRAPDLMSKNNKVCSKEITSVWYSEISWYGTPKITWYGTPDYLSGTGTALRRARNSQIANIIQSTSEQVD